MSTSKADLNERDICTKFITPAIAAAGWDVHLQVREQVTFTNERVIVRGKLVSRGQTRRADYLLSHRPNLPLAIIEAKDNSHSVGDGMQQALAYAEALDIPFVYSTNGDGFLEVWYYEHPYPPGAKSYSKTKPIRIEEFAPEKAWWGNRVENAYAWRVPVEQIAENGYNLDIKNPHQIDVEQLDPKHLLASYRTLLAEVAEAREALRRELAASLER